MSSAAFLATFNARFACSVRLRSGHEFDRSGQSHAKGGACANCFGCESRSGEMGMADAGFSLERKHGVLRLSWACPGCGITVTEDTSLMSSAADAKVVAADPLCHHCRTNKRLV